MAGASGQKTKEMEEEIVNNRERDLADERRPGGLGLKGPSSAMSLLSRLLACGAIESRMVRPSRSLLGRT